MAAAQGPSTELAQREHEEDEFLDAEEARDEVGPLEPPWEADGDASNVWSIVRHILAEAEAIGTAELALAASPLERLLRVHEKLLPTEGALDATIAMNLRERDVYADKMQRIARRLAAEDADSADSPLHDALTRVVLTTRDDLDAARAQRAAEAGGDAPASPGSGPGAP